jgi:hypothetical protein
MWQRCGVIGVLVDVKEDCSGNMFRDIVRPSVHRGRDADGRKGCVEDNDIGIV